MLAYGVNGARLHTVPSLTVTSATSSCVLPSTHARNGDTAKVVEDLQRVVIVAVLGACWLESVMRCDHR